MLRLYKRLIKLVVEIVSTNFNAHKFLMVNYLGL